MRTYVAREITEPQKIKALHKLQAKLPPLGKICVRRYVMRGHAVIAFDLGQQPLRWYYSADIVLVDNDPGQARASRPCVHCGQPCEPGAPDPCLGLMAETGGACCGHGQARDAYVGFCGPRGGDGGVLHGEDALRYFATHGVGPASALALVARERNPDVWTETNTTISYAAL